LLSSGQQPNRQLSSGQQLPTLIWSTTADFDLVSICQLTFSSSHQLFTATIAYHYLVSQCLLLSGQQLQPVV
jgi:hypothetical protein